MADPAYIVDGVLTDGEAWVGITTTTYGSDAGACTFTSTDDGQVGDFSQYMDLVVVGYARSAQADTNAYAQMRFNGNYASIYTYQELRGDGSAVAAATATSTLARVGFLNADSATANVFGTFVTHLFDVNSGKYKSGVSQSADDRDGSGYVTMYAFTWGGQAPVSSIEISTSWWGNWMAGSSFSLFGVLPRMVA